MSIEPALMVYLFAPALILVLLVSEHWVRIEEVFNDKLCLYPTFGKEDKPGDDNGLEWKTCPECEREMLKRDFLEHWEARHVEDLESPDDVETEIEAEEDDFSVSDYVDDYEVDWHEDETDGVELQEPSGSGDVDVDALRAKWSPVLDRLARGNPVYVKADTHLGGLRGNDILKRFERDMKRIDSDICFKTVYDEKKSVIRPRS